MGYLDDIVSGPVKFDATEKIVYVADEGNPDPYACDETQPSGFPVMAIDPGCRQPGDSPNREFAPVRPEESPTGLLTGYIKACAVGRGLEQELKPVLIVPADAPTCPEPGYRRTKSKHVPLSATNPCGPSMDHYFERGLTFDKDELGRIGQLRYQEDHPDGSDTQFMMLVPNTCGNGGKEARVFTMKEFRDLVLSFSPSSTPGVVTPDSLFVFHSTQTDTTPGTQQTFTVPANAKSISAEIWGAGGRGDGTHSYPFPLAGHGGYGGYTTFEDMLVTGGEQFAIVVGGFSKVLGDTTYGQMEVYGFGGKNSPDGHQSAGGGLSGIFTGPGPVVSTDASRAIAIAGGGGAGGATAPGQNMIYGGSGNYPNSGGRSNFQGANGTNGQFTGYGAGGGGYSGGNSIARNGLGGSGYVKTAVVSNPQVQYADPTGPLPPGTTSANYADNAAKPESPGLVVIRVKFN